MWDTEALGEGCYLGVPRPGTGACERSHWLMEMDGPSDLCTLDAVKQLVVFARYRVAQNGA